MPKILRTSSASPLESKIQRDIKNAVNALSYARLERNNKWSGWVVRDDGTRQYVEAGLPDGSADLIGCVQVDCIIGGESVFVARAFYLEVKRPGEKQRQSQIEWAKRARFIGAFYAVVHSVQEALAAVERCRKGFPQ